MILTRIAARDLSERLLIAQYDTAGRDYHLIQAQKYLLHLLAGGDYYAANHELVVDMIENAIADSTDIDATPHSQAVAVLNALIDSVVPK